MDKSRAAFLSQSNGIERIWIVIGTGAARKFDDPLDSVNGFSFLVVALSSLSSIFAIPI